MLCACGSVLSLGVRVEADGSVVQHQCTVE